jgi:hypothetical protein
MLLNDKYTLENIKEYLKKVSLYIRIGKQLRKTIYFNLEQFEEKDIDAVKSGNWYLDDYRQEFRYFHIAYCLFRGRTMDQIERGKDYIPHTSKIILEGIKEDMEEYNNDREKNVCAS